MAKELKLSPELAEALINAFKEFDTEVQALRLTLALFKELFQQFPEIAQAGLDAAFLDAALADAKANPSLLDSMNQKWSAILDTMRTEVIDTEIQKKIDQPIARLRPTDLLN
ncbi:MAG: hypothetical protein WAN72_18515 [Candidatus Acidiferrales bacterium]